MGCYGEGAKNASGRFCFIGFLSACVRRWRFCACRLQELVVFASGQGKKQIFSKESLRHYLGLFAALVIGMGVFYGLDVLAYSDPDWKDFRRFFDERTILYDYHLDFVEQYDENREAYEETGVSRTLQEMLKNYNFGAADEIDTQMLSSLAVQAKKTDAEESVLSQVKKAIWRLAHENWLSKSDLPWNFVWLAVVFAWCSCCLQKGNRRYFWQRFLWFVSAECCGAIC